MRILHFSDLHVWSRAFDWSDPAPKRFLGIVNLFLRRAAAFPPDYGKAIVADILGQDADFVIFSGDFTTAATRPEFETARAILSPIARKWGERFIYIPGNHDRYTARAVAAGHYERLFPAGIYENATAPIHRARFDIAGAPLSIVSFDASVPRHLESTGEFSAPLARALDETLAREAADARTVVLVGHFPYAAPADVKSKKGHRLVGARRLSDVIARRKPILYLHGHKHIRWTLKATATPETLCVNSGAAGMKSSSTARNAGYALIDIQDPVRHSPPPAITVRARVLTPGSTDSFTEFSLDPVAPAAPPDWD